MKSDSSHATLDEQRELAESLMEINAYDNPGMANQIMEQAADMLLARSETFTPELSVNELICEPCERAGKLGMKCETCNAIVIASGRVASSPSAIATPAGKRLVVDKPVAWIREWDGDESDLGMWVVEEGHEPPRDNHEWMPLYAEEPLEL